MIEMETLALTSTYTIVFQFSFLIVYISSHPSHFFSSPLLLNIFFLELKLTSNYPIPFLITHFSYINFYDVKFTFWFSFLNFPLHSSLTSHSLFFLFRIGDSVRNGPFKLLTTNSTTHTRFQGTHTERSEIDS